MAIGTVFLLSLFQFGIKKWYNPSAFFVGIWFLIAVLSAFQFFDLKAVSDKIYSYLFLGCVSFYIGGVLSRKINFVVKISKKKIGNRDRLDQSQISDKLFLSAIVIAIIIFVINSIPNIILYYQGYTIAEVRYQNIKGSFSWGSLGRIIAILNTFYAYPFLAASVVMLTNKYLLEKKFIKLIIPMSIVGLLILGVGAREIIIYAFVTSVIGIAVVKRSGLKIPKKFYLVGIILIVMYLYVSAGRNITGVEKNIRSIYHYMCSSLVLFEYTLANSSLYYMEHTYGVMSFLGFLRPAYDLLDLMGLTHFRIFDLAEQFQLDLQYTLIHTTTTNSGWFNYFATCFAHFYKDFGVFGIMILSFVYGIITTNVFKRLLSEPRNLRYLSLYMFLICGIFASMDDFQFINIRNAMPIVYILLLAPNYSNSYS